MKSMIHVSRAALVVACALVGSTTFAQGTAPVPGHPRVNEVNQRLDNQQQRIDNGVSNGTIGPRQAARDERHVANIAQRTSRAEARHGGHLTAGETRRLNRAENRNSKRIYRQKH
ncbi:MAG: hypothetical protein ABIR62_02690 [Dokdonella sp.]|uniref:hypothetical protein n=1 Tax=Dokdonella sp. TaxID=2291710 RepID=UPI003265539F